MPKIAKINIHLKSKHLFWQYVNHLLNEDFFFLCCLALNLTVTEMATKTKNLKTQTCTKF